MMKLVTVIGARPQFIKAAVVSRALLGYPRIKEFLIHTGQHYDENMSDIFFSDLNLRKPDINLGIHGGDNVSMISSMIQSLDRVYNEIQPHRILVYGDTNSTMAGALTAKMHHIPVTHVEAGMRNGDLAVPEELNRMVTDRVSDMLCCSTDSAMQNLAGEGYLRRNILLAKTGDVMYDAAVLFNQAACEREPDLLQDWMNNYILFTLHRAETVDNPDKLSSVFKAMDILSDKFPVLFPAHPRTRERIKQFGISINARMIEPKGYLDMLNLTRNCRMVITDSGGLQKEAYFFKKYSVVLRDVTEWKELQQAGYALVSGTDTANILRSVEDQIKKPVTFREHFFGDGDAGIKIANMLHNACV